MKVLALVTDAFGGYGGIAQYNRDLLTAVASTPGVERVEVLPRLAPEAVGGTPENLWQQAPALGRLAYAEIAAVAARRLKPDLIFNGHLYHGPLASFLAKSRRARLVSQVHGTEIWTRLRRSHRRALEASDLILTVSRDTFGLLREHVPAAKRTGVVLANTVQREFCPGDRDAARARFGIPQGVKALLSVSRLDARDGYKGHDRILRLLPKLDAAGRNLVYLIAGVGPDEERLRRLADEVGVSRIVRFLGKVPYPDLPDLYRASDLFVLPSTGEGFGIVYVEAMACGTPALGLRAGGAPDALGDGELGWCVPEDELASAVAQALDAPRPDPQALYDSVQARFGQDAFQARVASLIGGLT